jgi:hypothetical protein
MAVGLPLKVTYADGDVYSASDVNDTNGTVNLFTSSTLSLAAGKNPIINGGADVWARGTSVSVAALAAPAYTADRLMASPNTNNALTISRQATSDTTNLPSIQYCLRFQRNSGQTGTGQVNLSQSIETTNSIPFAGKTVTFSFYARKGANYSANSNTLGVQLFTGTGTDQNIATTGFTGFATPINSSATLTATWQRFTFTGTLAATTTQIAPYFIFTPTGTAGANDYFEITGLQLELGSVATTFSRAGGTIQGELAACQRYYFRATASATFQPISLGSSASTTATYSNVQSPVTMRSTISSIDYGGTLSVFKFTSGGYHNTGTFSLGATLLGNSGAQIAYTHGSAVFTAGDTTMITSYTSTTAYIGMSAEL